MKNTFFIAGTDTEVGKTYVSTKLLIACHQQGWSTLGIKPIASGGMGDTHALQNASSIKLPSKLITPFLFEQAIAPHIAARLNQCELNLHGLQKALHLALNIAADIKIIEGCGGWYTPLNDMETMADFVIANMIPVILIIGIRLGCINHSLLTLQAMQNDGVNVIGWIANCLDPKMKNQAENIQTLHQWLDKPCLGIINHNGAYTLNAKFLSFL